MQQQRALEAMGSHMMTGIDLMRHPPKEVVISDESLTGFGLSLTLTANEINHIKTIAEKVLTECINPLSNVRNIGKIIFSENHLFFSGRNDSGFDLVVLMNLEEDLVATCDSIKRNVTVLTSGTVGSEAAGVKSSMPNSLQFDFQDVHVRIAVGHMHHVDEKTNRETVWKKIEELDKNGKLKKVHLDQFAVDLYESQTMFMHHQVAHDGGSTPNERFVQSALRLARAWRQCALSHRDIQFTPLDAWLVMLHAVHTEVSRTSETPETAAAAVGGTVTGIRKTIKELFIKKGVTGKIQAGGHEVSMKNVFKEFLTQLTKLEQMNIHFEDVYEESRIPDWIKTQRPLVLDPVCPYRNTLFNLHQRVSDDLNKHAAECMKMLDDPHATLPKLFNLPTYKKRGA